MTVDSEEKPLMSTDNGTSYSTVAAKEEIKEPTYTDAEKCGKVIPTSFAIDLERWKAGLVEGTIPQSFFAAVVIGGLCSIGAYLYYLSLWFLLDYVWHDLPSVTKFNEIFPEWAWFLWIPIVGFVMASLVGLSVVYLGEPGDLAYVVKCVHAHGFIHENHMIPMIAASQFSIIGGGSLGPEAPLVAICAGIAAIVSRYLLKTQNLNVIRKHTLMGMCAALAAFFGAPLGGSLFALEINSRFGCEYFEHAVEAMFCGEICLVGFRYLAGLSIDPIWHVGSPLTGASPYDVAQGMFVGFLGGLVAMVFRWFHWDVVMAWFGSRGLLDNKKAVTRALIGAVPIMIIGILIPHTLFWGEYEIQEILSLAPAKDLNHVWPTTGATGFEMNTCFTSFLVGFGKMIAISFTVAAGYRGGFIFPFFLAGSAFGQSLAFLIPMNSQLASLCFAAAINVSITRTPLGTTLILSFLSGEENAVSVIFASSCIALYLTAYMPFLKSQIPRKDIDQALVYEYKTVTGDAVASSSNTESHV